MSKRQLCTINNCPETSIPGMQPGCGKCQYHWNVGAYGVDWADRQREAERKAAQDATVAAHEAADLMTECQNCSARLPESMLNPIKDLRQRVAQGEPIPSGECPD